MFKLATIAIEVMENISVEGYILSNVVFCDEATF
jgi:hypothetical protein